MNLVCEALVAESGRAVYSTLGGAVGFLRVVRNRNKDAIVYVLSL